MKEILEGLLFVVGEDGLTLKELEEILELSTDEVLILIEQLKEDYITRGITIEILGNKYKLTTKIEHQKYYEKLAIQENNKEMSQAMLETLAIIAYNEPITRTTIDEIRGISTSHIVRKLLMRELIKSLGKSEMPGRPVLYGTTNKFLDYFGLKSIDELPIIQEKEETNTEVDLFKSKYSEE